MDQRVNGEPPPPPSSASSLDTPPAPREPGQVEQAAERRSKGKNSENGDVGDGGSGKEEKKGAGRKREGNKGAVLELLIEGRCGSAGQQQLQISSKETSCPEGNVRLRIGLQAKRTKKPPKILESYVCKPTVRTYQRQGRGQPTPPPPPRADGGTGGAGQQCKSRPAVDRSARDRCSGLDTVQLTSRQSVAAAASQAPQAFALSSSPTSTSTTLATLSTTASLPGVNSPVSRSSKQVPFKLADKGEVNTSGSSDRAKKEKFPCGSNQPVPLEQTSCPPVAERSTSVSFSASLVQVYPASEPRNEGNTSKKHNGSVGTTKKKGQQNGNSAVSTLASDPSSQLKAGKQSSSFSTRPPGSSGADKNLSKSGKSEASSPCSPSVDLRPQLSPAEDLSPARLQSLEPFLLASLEKKREKERRAKRERVKEKKSKRNEADRTLGEFGGGGVGGEDGRKKKTEKRKQGRRDGKDGQKADDKQQDEMETNGGNTDKLSDRLSPDRTEEQHLANCGDAVILNTKPDRSSRAPQPGSPDEVGIVAELATGDGSKSKKLDLARHTSVAPPISSSYPLPHPHPPSSTAPPSRSPREQDNRPLKKRKTRRPSWTKLVQRAQRAESLITTSSNTSTTSSSTTSSCSEARPRTLCSPPESAKRPSSKQADESQHSTSSCRFSTSSSSTASRFSVTSAKKRGRPKSHSYSLGDPHPRHSLGEYQDADKVSTMSEFPRKILQSAVPPPSTPSPKKRGRPPKRPITEDQAEVGDRQLKIRKLIDEMKKRKKRRKLHKVAVEKEGRNARAEANILEVSPRSLPAATVQSLAALSSSFGSRLGPQINVSKRGTIYMGKRRGRKPKSQTPPSQVNQGGCQTSGQSPPFSTPSEVSLFSHPPHSHPFPSPSLTHSSGAQSPYSEGGLTEPTSSSLLFSQPFSLPSPSSPCTSPHLTPASLSLSSFVRRSCPCQGRPHFPFHQSSCKLLLSPTQPLPPHHHTPGSPGAPSPRSESHSEETLPSDSGIGTDNNSVSERGGEAGAARGIRRPGQGSGVRPGGGLMHPSARLEQPPSASSPLCRPSRHMNPIGSPASAERHRDRHRHRRRDYQCATTVAAPSCSCLCRCSYPGHKGPHADFYPCLGHSTVKRQKAKHKKKQQQQQLHMQDPEFLADLEDVIGQLGEIHIGRRSWARAGLEQSFEGGGGVGGGGGGRRLHHHSSSSHSSRSNIFRINLNGYYSPHPASYFQPSPLYACQPLHCSRKAERRQCGCPSNFQETVDNLGFYSYQHLPASYTLPSSHQQPHHAHFIINPARFHRRRSRLLREGALGGDIEGDLDSGGGGSAGGAGAGGGLHLSPGFTPSLSCGCGRSEHKPKLKQRHRHCERDLEDEEEELNEDEEEEEEEERAESGAKFRSGFMVSPGSGGGGGRKASRPGMGGMTLSRESPWIREKGSDLFSAAAAAAAAAATTAAKSMLSSTDRYKHTALTSLGLGSTHLSSFGGGWGGLGQSLTPFGGLGGTGFPKSGFGGFNGEQRVGQLVASEGEEEDDVLGSPPYKAPRSQTHTNLFTSTAVEKGGRGLRSRWASRTADGSERSWRTEEPAWTERREAALQGNWIGHRGQQRSPPSHYSNNNSGGEVNKRRPGRPRKHPLPAAPTTTTHPPTAAAVVSSPDLLVPGQRRLEPDPDVDAVTEEEALQAVRKKAGRKRKHDKSPFHQSVSEDEPDGDAGFECLGHWDSERREEEAASTPPRKNFLRAGLYSDDYKTANPPTQSQQQLCKDSVMELTPDERDYSLLPAPIHVGKYLRLKRIHFQLPYDVMWLWQHNQLHRPPSVPLKRKRRYCRLKERRLSSHQTAGGSCDIASLFPHINMEPLTGSERSFVLQHHVFLVRNWKLVRDKQIRLRVERQQDEEEEEEEEEEGEEDDEEEEGEEVTAGPGPVSCNGSVASDNHIKSDQRWGAEVELTCSDPHLHYRQCQNAPRSPAASPHATTNQHREEEEEGEEENEDEETLVEEKTCSREQRRKRLNDLLLTLQHS